MPALHQRERPVIVAVAGMDMVQPAIDQIIDMVAVRHRFMAAIRPVHMGAGQLRGAAIGIGGGNRDHMFINMIAVDMMEMAIVQIISVAIVPDGGVAAAGTVNMGMIGVDMAGHRRNLRKFSAGPPGCGCPTFRAT
jgi:hypothetical protein